MAAPADKDTPISLGRLDQYLGFQLKRLQNELSRALSERTQDFNLRSGMLSMLELILSNPGISQVKLGQEIGMDKSAVGILVDELERRELVLRQRSKVDRRLYELSITDAGRVTLERLFEELAYTEKVALAALEPDELASIARILDKVYHAYVRSSQKTR